MSGDGPHSQSIPDASAAYHLWDELVVWGLKLACSTGGDSAAEQLAAWQRLLRGHQRSLRQRDEMWTRIVASLERGADGR